MATPAVLTPPPDDPAPASALLTVPVVPHVPSLPSSTTPSLRAEETLVNGSSETPITSLDESSPDAHKEQSVIELDDSKEASTSITEGPKKDFAGAEESTKTKTAALAPPPIRSSWAEVAKSSPLAGSVARPAVHKVNDSVASGNVTLMDVLESFDASRFSAPVIEPRGLINTGNMCFMNAVRTLFISAYFLANNGRFYKC